jgi:hypothetical protein
MRKLAFVGIAAVVLGLMIAPAAKADPACTNASIVIGAGAISSCSFGGLTFSNFAAVNAGAVPSPLVIAVTFTTDASGNILVSFNPNLTSPVQDLWFFFTVSGGINAIDLAVGGLNATINETACSVLIPLNSGICPSANILANINATTGNTAIGNFPGGTAVSPVFIFKDINVQTGGSLTNFQQSFHPVPEPGTLALFGSGLLSIAGLIRRKLSS